MNVVGTMRGENRRRTKSAAPEAIAIQHITEVAGSGMIDARSRSNVMGTPKLFPGRAEICKFPIEPKTASNVDGGSGEMLAGEIGISIIVQTLGAVVGMPMPLAPGELADVANLVPNVKSLAAL
jgi:hypothetical protein